ncbi:hypothetical protein DAPPUDRAFT_261483 [Daphnia pulex]|uniref:Uncharacterized protein n=1 Tax=Daphnia pulex TaxID=6669 RepID=E9HL38_DAPPU|nr:hypothetical protein DAPPUDRAFT_261483 [Daphnia pulex]|eukprot:EFX67552.1 hypothetical protein DAPPUDRAFT_261483 [Daphnia pulex]
MLWKDESCPLYEEATTKASEAIDQQTDKSERNKADDERCESEDNDTDWESEDCDSEIGVAAPLTPPVILPSSTSSTIRGDVVRVIETLQCDSRKAMHERVISTAQYNGWLAASMVRLPKCTKLTAYGKTALAISCKANEVDFSVELSACGPQPKYKNLTINRD